MWQRYVGITLLSVTFAWAEPIDTTTFGLLPIGATETEVHAKVGAPDMIEYGELQGYIVHHGHETSHITQHYDGVIFFHQRNIWIYYGGSQRMTSYLTFEDGKLIHKEKRP